MLFSKALAALLPKSLVCRTANSQQHVSILLARQPRQSKASTLMSLSLCELCSNVCQHREHSQQSSTPQALPRTLSWGETEPCCRRKREGKGFYPSSTCHQLHIWGKRSTSLCSGMDRIPLVRIPPRQGYSVCQSQDFTSVLKRRNSPSIPLVEQGVCTASVILYPKEQQVEPYPDLRLPFSSFPPSLFSLLCLQETLHSDKILQEDIFFGTGPWDTVTSRLGFLIFHGGGCCLRNYLSEQQSLLCAALFTRHSMCMSRAKSGLDPPEVAQTNKGKGCKK